MELNVIQRDSRTDQPWYAAGLTFTCSQCGNCCTGGPGYVWISNVEIDRLAEHLKIPRKQVIERYCRKVEGKYSLKEHRNAQGLYDCTFLKEVKVASEGNGDQVVHTKRICTVYPVRPLQCRTWPFWSENLASPDRWNRSAVRCPGMNRGGRTFTREQIEALRDAKDWPQAPPTSG